MKNWEANIRRVTPYTPGEQPREPRMIKLNTNETPYPPSPAVEQAAKELGADRLGTSRMIRLMQNTDAGAGY